MTESARYTDEQKNELTRLFAGLLYDAMQEIHPSKIDKLTEKLLAEARTREWFRYDKSKYGVLRHLEEAGVYGVYDFFPEGRSTLYLRAVFSVPFQERVRQTRPSKEAFIQKLMNPKISGAHKPSPEEMRGNTSVAGGKRMNMHTPLSSR